MWKHKTKWLVRGGRKVRCYLCGKKILAKGDLFLFHGDTGYYSHQSCLAESTTISGNERRRAVKKIAVGAAVVGAIAAGAGKFIDVSSQSKNSPAAQTILTSQGLILPALTSDPANPVAGQMWYRSDKGVTAHFDAIENRVIYSNRIVNGSAVVTSKGIVNGLSVLPNDGQDWGPDTTKGATAPGQYGGTYTETSGMQEAYNYLKSVATTQNAVTIRLLDGNFYLNANVNINIGDSTSTSTNPSTCHIFGSGKRTTYVWINKVGLDGIVYSAGSGASIEDTVWSDFSLDVGYGDYGANDIASNTTGNGANSMFQFVLLQSAGQGSLINFINMSFFTGNYSSGYGPTNGGLYIAGPLNITAMGCTFAGDRILNIQGGGGSSLPLTSYSVNQFATFVGCYVGTSQELMIFSGYQVSFIGSNIVAVITGMDSGGLPMSFTFESCTIVQTTITLSGQPVYNIMVKNSAIAYTTLLESTATSTVNNVIIDSCSFYKVRSPFVSGVTVNGIFKITNGYLLAGSMPAILPSTTPTISTNPPVSGTTYQNANPYDIRLKIPVTYSPTSSAAATLATGTSSTSTVTTSTKVSYPAGITTGIVNTYEMVVPAGQYFELVVTNATIGTAEVQVA